MKNPVLSASMAFLIRFNLQFTSKIENWRFDLNRVWCGPESRIAGSKIGPRGLGSRTKTGVNV